MKPMKSMKLLLALCAFLASVAMGADFAARFESFKTNASPSDLYRLLYAMPKAGDLHHHAGGCWRMEDLYNVATNVTRNGGNRFYTRIKAGSCPDDATPWRRFTTIAAFTWKDLTPCQQSEYVPLDELPPGLRAEFIDSSASTSRARAGRSSSRKYGLGSARSGAASTSSLK